MQQWLTAEEYRSPETVFQRETTRSKPSRGRKRGNERRRRWKVVEAQRNKIAGVGQAVHDAGEFDPSTCFPNEKLRLQKLEWRHTDTCYALPLLDRMLYYWDLLRKPKETGQGTKVSMNQANVTCFKTFVDLWSQSDCFCFKRSKKFFNLHMYNIFVRTNEKLIQIILT